MGLEQFSETQNICDSIILNAASSTTVTTFTATSRTRARYDVIIVTSTSAADHVLALYMRTGSTNYRLGAVTIPANAGNGTVPSVELLATIVGLTGGITINGSTTPYAGLDVALTGAETITLTAFGGLI